MLIKREKEERITILLQLQLPRENIGCHTKTLEKHRGWSEGRGKEQNYRKVLLLYFFQEEKGETEQASLGLANLGA